MSAPDWLHLPPPRDRAILFVRIREGLICVAERKGHKGLAIGLRLLADLPGFLAYATGRPGHVTAHAAALWNTWQPNPPDEEMNDLLDTCCRMMNPDHAPDYWGDFLGSVRGALAS